MKRYLTAICSTLGLAIGNLLGTLHKVLNGSESSDVVLLLCISLGLLAINFVLLIAALVQDNKEQKKLFEPASSKTVARERLRLVKTQKN